MTQRTNAGIREFLAIVLVVNFVLSPGEALAVAHGETNSSGPTGDSEASVSADEVSVDESSGTVSLSIPIELPPGPNGQQPQVGLGYSSAAGNGLAGVGWSLPVSKVTCSTRFGLPDYLNCDRFELDGEVLVGPAPKNNPTDLDRYHTFNESFARIIHLDSTDQWTVTSVDGVTRTYGSNFASEARVSAPSGATAEWYLHRVVDPFGNAIEYDYEAGPAGTNPDAGYLRPSVIRYAGGTAREVEFIYEPRPDPIVNYSGGIRTRISERLSGIKVFVQGNLHSRHQFEYEQSISSNVSRLISAQRFGNDCDPDSDSLTAGPDCSALPPMVFTYTDSGQISREERWQEMGKPVNTSDPAWFLSGPPSFSTGNIIAAGAENMQLGDINGDGYSDVIFDAEGRQDRENSVAPDGNDGNGRAPAIYLHNGEKGAAARWEKPTWNGGAPHPDLAPGATNTPDNLSAEWSDRLSVLRFDIPSLRVKQVESISEDTLLEDLWEVSPSQDIGEPGSALGTCIESAENDSLPAVSWKLGGGSIQLGKRAPYMSAPSWDSTQARILLPGADSNNPNYDPYGGVRPLVPLDVPHYSEIRPFPHFQIVDLNADGLADFVMSVHLSGFNMSLDDCATAQIVDEGDEIWIPGATTRVVFLNNGSGWDLDTASTTGDGNIADTLPLFGIVAFESSDLAYLRSFDVTPPTVSYSRLISPCDDAGLAGVRGPMSGYNAPIYPWNFESWDFCVVGYDLTPVFQDLNGDGYPDVIVKETSDKDALFHGWYNLDGWEPSWRVATTESVAWIQNPHATGTEPRWTREPAFDPPVPHAIVAQWGNDTSPPSNAQVNNLDRAVRFADLNRDGLVDMIADTNRPGPTTDPSVTTPFMGAILNRGAEPGAARYSAWCASSPVGTATTCATDAAPYTPPASFSPEYIHDNPGWSRSTIVAQNKGQLFQVSDLNGDGWVDILTTVGGTGSGRAYIQQPGRSGSVWVSSPAFVPDAAGYLYREFCQSGVHNGPGASCSDSEQNVFTSGFGFLDANGDGVLDIIASNEGNFPQKESMISTPEGAHSDLLATYSNGQGAHVELTYATARLQRDATLEAKAYAHAEAPLLDADATNDARAEALWADPDPTANRNWPTVSGQVYWPSHPVLQSKTVSVANSAPATTSYKYAHPRRCRDHNTEFGFRLVEVTNADESKVESFYFQKHGRSGQLSERTIFDEDGAPVHFAWSDWETPDPATVEGGLSLGGDDLYNVAHIGRQTSMISRNEYGSVVGETPGFETRIDYVYNDSHGYNFVAEELRTVPGRNSKVENTPHTVDDANYLVLRKHRVSIFANQAYDSRLLSQQFFGYTDRFGQYTYDKPGKVTELISSRDDPQGSEWRRTYFSYSDQGNLTAKRIQEGLGSTDPSRTTSYCYDGDSGCAVGQNSHSLLVRTRDAAGRYVELNEPHDVFATPTKSSSYYADVPTATRKLDAFGRVIEEGYESAGGSSIKLSEVEYFDAPASGLAYGEGYQPFLVSRQFATEGGPAAIETITVSNGGGASMMSIALLQSVSGGATSVAAVATESSSNPVTRETQTTESFACPAVNVAGTSDYGAVIAACAAVPDVGKTEIASVADAMGRPLRIDTPLGFEVLRYSASSEVVIGSGASTPHDAVLHKNANGGLRESIMAGEKPVRIRDCNNATLDPDLSDLSSVSCQNADESILAYEPTGEPRERVDPTVVDNGGYSGFNVGAFANQRLRYSYDTLGRILSIEDPDAGVSSQQYNAFDNLTETTDARGITVTTTYDVLNRPLQISSPNETPTNYEYVADLLQLERMLAGDVSEKLFEYDDLGRVSREIRWVDAKMMRTEFELDLMGRPTEIRYPTVVNGAIDSIGYVYDGQFLDRICDIGGLNGDCDSAFADVIVSDVVYDELGRIETMSIPGGVRTFNYDGNSSRRMRDEFDSATGGQDITFAYEMPGDSGVIPAYDPLGNLLRVDATLGTEGGSATYQHQYTYDARNRIDTWKWNGDETDYDYDRRGNLIKRADEVQDFTSGVTAHAIQTRTVPDGATYSYTYDASGNLKSRTSSAGGTLHYTFDDRGRLICVGAVAAGCDELAVTYSGDGERIKEVGSDTYVYAGPDFRYRMDASGNVAEYWIEINTGGGRVAYKHVYGGALRIVEMFPTWEIPLWFGNALLALAWIMLAGTAVTVLVYVAACPRPIYGAACTAMTVIASILPIQVWAGGGITNPHGTGTEVFRWVMSDAIGSGLVEVDAAGQRLSHAAYEPFGDVATSWGSSGVGGRKYYAGHDRQLDVDLVYMNARWMNPGSGTFISVDPLVREATVAQSFNGYAYVENNPVAAVDPTGMLSDPCKNVSCDFYVGYAIDENGKTYSLETAGKMYGAGKATINGQFAPSTPSGTVNNNAGQAAPSVGSGPSPQADLTQSQGGGNGGADAGQNGGVDPFSGVEEIVVQGTRPPQYQQAGFWAALGPALWNGLRASARYIGAAALWVGLRFAPSLVPTTMLQRLTPGQYQQLWGRGVAGVQRALAALRNGDLTRPAGVNPTNLRSGLEWYRRQLGSHPSSMQPGNVNDLRQQFINEFQRQGQ